MTDASSIPNPGPEWNPEDCDVMQVRASIEGASPREYYRVFHRPTRILRYVAIERVEAEMLAEESGG